MFVSISRGPGVSKRRTIHRCIRTLSVKSVPGCSVLKGELDRKLGAGVHSSGFRDRPQRGRRSGKVVLRYAFIADVHGEVQRLSDVLATARREGAQRIVSLGDIGNDECYDLLREAGAVGTFGNYEVSGYRNLTSRNQAFVLALPPVYVADGFVAAHAVPSYPAGLFNVADFYEHRHRTGGGWRTIFRYPNEHDDSFWTIYAALLARNKDVLFHGHNHRQAVWQVEAGSQRVRRIAGSSIVLEPGSRYIVGAGSVGRPEDGPVPRYLLFDDEERRIELHGLIQSQDGRPER